MTTKDDGAKSKDNLKHAEEAADMNVLWLACKVLKGMFPGEVAVLVSTAEGRSISLFVPDTVVKLLKGSLSDIDGNEVDGKIRVRLIDRDEKFGLVALPGKPIEGPNVVKVEGALLTAAAA